MLPAGGILEDMVARLQALEELLAAMGECGRTHSALDQTPGGIAAGNPSVDIWLGGAISVTRAPKEYGISRSELYRLIEVGECPSSKPSRERLVPRRWLVEHLAKCAERQAGVTDAEATR